MMPWYAWVLVSSYVVGALAAVATIGRPRAPRTPLEAVVAIVLNGLMVWAILALAGVV